MGNNVWELYQRGCDKLWLNNMLQIMIQEKEYYYLVVVYQIQQRYMSDGTTTSMSIFDEDELIVWNIVVTQEPS